jgi:hypothetical protein
VAKTILNKDIQDKVVQALEGGNWIETAANYAGIAPSTLYSWLDRGRKEQARRDEYPNDPNPKNEEKYVEFLESVEKARARAEVQSVALIRKAAIDGTWTAAAWFLERSHPRRWGRMDRHEVAGAEGGAIQVEAVSAKALEDKITAILGGTVISFPELTEDSAEENVSSAASPAQDTVKKKTKKSTKSTVDPDTSEVDSV